VPPTFLYSACVQGYLYGLAGGAMEISKESQKSAKNPMPVIGVETHELLGNKSVDQQFSRTAECAYYKAEARGFEPGHEVEDWLAAEAEANQ